MIFTSPSKYILCLVFTALTCVFIANPVQAQVRGSGVSITVAPTLIELGTQPGEIWRSSLKVVNTNTFPLTVYVEPAHFAPAGEQGQGNIVPHSAIPDDEPVLANWITVPEEVATIEPGKSTSVPFIVETPDSAAPGSHFAALQVSTVPSSRATTVGLNTAQVISSLLFLRVTGDIEEAGTIRSFTATNAFQSVAKSELQVRFENTGNSHVQPIGEIVITNMWGSERGRIPVNINTSFGNALPKTIRAYDFAWQRKPGLLDIGYHTAAVTLAYGSEEKQFASAKTGFWVIPIKPILFTLFGIVAIISVLMLISRWYIRRLLAQAGVSSLQSLQKPSASTQHDLDLVQARLEARTAIPSDTWWGVVSRRLRVTLRAAVNQTRTLWHLLPIRARWGVVAVTALLLVGLAVLLQLSSANQGYEATIGADNQSVTYNAEEIAFFQQPGMAPDKLTTDLKYQIILYNASREPGLAGRYAAELIDEFPITALKTASDRRARSVIIFPAELQAEAVALSEVLPGALLSATDSATTSIRVYLAE